MRWRQYVRKQGTRNALVALELDVRFLNDLTPTGDLGFHQRAELRTGDIGDFGAVLGPGFLHGRMLERGRDFLDHAVDDLLWRALGREQRVPRGNLITL